MRPHIKAAHAFWSQIVRPTDQVIDATAGRGHDTLFLAKLVMNGAVHAIDIQPEAIDSTRTLLKEENCLNQVHLYNQSHANFPKEIAPGSVRLIVYNLGYLPKGDKTVTTEASATLISLEKALTLLMPGGAISITLYPGHPEGAVEKKSLLEWIKTLSKEWKIEHLEFETRETAPSLLLLTRQPFDSKQ